MLAPMFPCPPGRNLSTLTSGDMSVRQTAWWDSVCVGVLFTKSRPPQHCLRLRRHRQKYCSLLIIPVKQSVATPKIARILLWGGGGDIAQIRFFWMKDRVGILVWTVAQLVERQLRACVERDVTGSSPGLLDTFISII